MYENIPMELRERPQWVCWRYEVVNGRQTKVPYSPHGQYKANIHTPGSWGTFNEAVTAARAPALNGIGFVLTEADPYTGIDIDNKPENPASPEEQEVHRRILEQFDSYTERSVGGSGYHIIIKGKIDGGRDRGHVGVYSTQRYLTFTGDVVRNAPIKDYQDLLLALVAQMPQPVQAAELVQEDGILTDQQLIDMAMGAANADKFNALCRGEWEELGYPSRSEADYSLMSMFAFYSKDNEQCRRLFRYTVLGQREKHQRGDYHIDRMLTHMRAKELPPIDLSSVLSAAVANAAPLAPQQPATPEAAPSPQPSTEAVPVAPLPRARAAAHGYELPPGLIGELASYFHTTSIRPVQEMALAAAIGLVAGVAGRAYNISGTGLNQYLLILAKTGSGKEGVAKGISNLLNAIRPQVPMADDFIGPSAFASGQALIRVLDSRPCFMSLMGEFGLRLQAMNDPRASAPERLLKTVLLDLYGKSGFSDVLRSTAYSDQEKNTKSIRAPAVTIVGESTPETFYEGINAGDIADGLIPRFHVIEYTGPRPPRNKNANSQPSAKLMDSFCDLLVTALTVQNNQTVQPVTCEAPALALLDAFDTVCDDHVNGASTQGEAQLWNRAHLKALKMAGLLAVGVDPHNPVVTEALATWAIKFVQDSTATLLAKFFSGEVGQGDNKQEADLRKVIEEYMELPAKLRGTYKVKKDLWEKRLISRDYLWRRCSRMASFYKDKRGAAQSLDNVLKNMVANGSLSTMTPQDAKKHFGAAMGIYYVGDSW